MLLISLNLPRYFPLFQLSSTTLQLEMADATTVQELQDSANRMRILAIEMTCAAKSGHPTSSCSAAEIIAVLFFSEMRYDPNSPRDVNADRFVLSKGHACPILYAAWVEAGHLSKDQVMTLRQINSDIEGHPTPVSFIPTSVVKTSHFHHFHFHFHLSRSGSDLDFGSGSYKELEVNKFLEVRRGSGSELGLDQGC